MGNLLDSVGLGIAFAGVVIGLAGVFLTPMRGVLANGLRSRLGRRTAGPPVETTPAQDPHPAPARAAKVRAAASDSAAREQEALFARTLITAQRAAEDLVRKAQGEAQEIIEQAHTTASDIVGAGRRNVSEMLQKAGQDAEQIVAAANERAAARLVLLQAEIEQLVVDAHQAFEDAQRSVQQSAASLTSRWDLYTADANPGAPNGDREEAPPAPDAGTASEPHTAGMTWPPLSDEEAAAAGAEADAAPPIDQRAGQIA